MWPGSARADSGEMLWPRVRSEAIAGRKSQNSRSRRRWRSSRPSPPYMSGRRYQRLRRKSSKQGMVGSGIAFRSSVTPPLRRSWTSKAGSIKPLHKRHSTRSAHSTVFCSPTADEIRRARGLPQLWGFMQLWRLAGVGRWLARISAQSRSRACRCRQRNEPEGPDRHRVATNASAAICSSAGSPGNSLFLP
jgi:hypothetical protein